MKRMLVFVLIAAIAFSSLLVGCSNSGGEASTDNESKEISTSKEPIEVTFLHIYGGSNGKVVDSLIEEFHKKQDNIRVSPVYVEGNYEGIMEKLQVLAASKQLPEIALGGFNYTTYMIDTMPLVPVQEFIDKEKMDVSDFFPTMLELGKGKDGKMYGLPFAVSTPIVFYNKELFKEAGLDPEKPPKTFDELRKAAKKLTKDGQKGVYFHYDITGNWMIQAMTETLGGKMIADNQKSVAFDQEPGVKALQYLVDLINVDKSMPNVSGNQAMQDFTTGKLGMFVSTTAYLGYLQKSSKFEVGTAIFPVDEIHPRKVPGGGNNIYVMESTPEKEQAAWEFVRFITSAEGTMKIAEGMGYMATHKSVVEHDEFLGRYLKENPAAYTTYLEVDDMVQWSNFPGKGGTRIFKIIQDNVQAAIAQQKSAEQALKDSAAEANKLMKY